MTAKKDRAARHQLPETGFLRISQIIGDTKAVPPIPALIPVCRSTWWAGVRSGRFPAPVKLGYGTTVWRVEDIRAFIESDGSASPKGGGASVSEAGMTLRDYFAAKALNAVINMDYPMSDLGYSMKDGKSIGENYAICAYELADAMLAARGSA